MILKGCVRCGGDLMNQGQRDYGHEWVCVQCGRRPVHVDPEVRAEEPQGRARTMRYAKDSTNGRRRDRGKGRKVNL